MLMKNQRKNVDKEPMLITGRAVIFRELSTSATIPSSSNDLFEAGMIDDRRKRETSLLKLSVIAAR